MPLTISAASVNALIADPSSITGYSASTAIVIEGQITTAQASQLNTVVAPSITATVAPAAASVLSAITVRSDRTNAFTLTPTETSATASVLKGVKDKTSLNGDFSNVTTIAASPSADITALFAPLASDGTTANSTFKIDITINVSDTSIAASTLNAINLLSSTAIVAPATTITGGAADVKSALGAGIAHEDDVAVTITEATTNATLLNDVNALTLGLVTVQSTAITGTYAAVNTALAANAGAGAITGLGAANVTLTAANGTAANYTPTEINTIDALTTGTITASTAAATKALILDTANGGTNGLDKLDGTHNITIPAITDASISGEQLNSIDAKTTVAITTNATTITGAYAAIAAAYASNGITGLGNEAITVTGGITVTQANALNALTPGVVTATISTADMATLAGLTDNLDSNGVQVNNGATPPVAVENVYTIVPTDTTVAATALTALNSKTANGTAIDATNITTITGTLAEVGAIYTSTGIVTGISNLNNEAVTISDTGSIDADLFQQINAATTGTVTISGTVTNLTGTAANIAALYVSKATTPPDTAFTNNPTITITGATAAAADLIAIDAATTSTVTVNAAKITGTKAHIDTVLTANAATPVDGNTITGIAVSGANAIVLDISTPVAIANLETYTGLTTGEVTAEVVGTNISTLLLDANKAKMGTGNKLSFTVTGSTVAGPAASDDILAADLIALNALTSGSILAVTAGSIKGSIADLKTVYNANTAKAAGPAAPAGSVFSGLEAEPMVVSDTAINASDLIYLTGKNGALTVTHAATHLSGTSAEILAVYTADEQGSPTIAGTTINTILTVTDSSISTTNLGLVNAKSNAAVTFTGTTLSGSGNDLEDALLRNVGLKWNVRDTSTNAATNEFLSGLDAVNLVATALTPAEISFLEDYTTGTISAAVTGGSAAALLGASKIDTLSRVHNLAITVTDASFTAANIAALNAKTSGTVTVNSATISGNSSQLLAAYAANDTTAVDNLGNENLTVTGGISVSDLNTLASKTSGIITATITDTSAATLKTISESGHSLTISIADTTVTATDVSAIDALTASDVTVGATTTISGSLTEIEAVQALATAGTTVLNNNPLTFTESLTRVQANIQHALTTGIVTATISDTVLAELTQLTGTANGANAYTITTSETSLTGAQIIAINTRTTVPVNASSVTTLSGTAADILTVLVENSDFDTDYTTAKARTITGLDAVVVTPTAGQTATVAQIFGIEKLTTGLVTATVAAAGDDQDLDFLMNTTSGIGLTNPNNAISVTVDDDGGSQNISAADLVTLNSRTTGLITVTVTAISGSVADLKTAFAANANPAVAGTQITGLQADNVIITFPTGAATTIAATDLNILDAYTDGTIDFTNATQLTGVGTLDANGASPVKTALDRMVANELIWGSGGTADKPPVTLSGNVSVADVNVISALTGGAVTATISDGTMAALNTLNNETGNAYTITITDTTADAGDLDTLNGRVTVAVNAAALTSITGTRTEVDSVYAADAADPKTITGLGNENITISSANLTRTQINTAAAYTTGSLKASVAADSIADYGTITENGNELALNVTDVTVVAATLNNLRARTTGVVNVQATTINGSLSDIGALYAAQTAGTVTGLGAETIGITDTGTVAASDLNVIDGINATAISAATVTGLTGTATAVNTAYASTTGITGLANEAVTITGATTAAADIITANANTTGVVTVNSSTITGTKAQIVDLYAANTAGTVAGLGNEAITITENSITVAEANAVDALTSGAVTATIVDNDVDTLATLTGTGNAYSIVVSDTAVSASNLNTLNAKTTSAISVTSTSISGSSTDLITAYLAQGSGVTGLGSETVTVTSGLATTATVSALKLNGGFDAPSYLASNTDVLAALGTNSNNAHGHFIDYGYAETRSLDTFSELSYIASYSDLIAAFGANGSSGTTHFVNHGYSEGRSSDNFDELGYVASYSDLITAIGSSATGAATHYINYGSTEGRTATFDASSYLSNYADLSAAFGSDQELAKKHYIDYGYAEGRTVA